MNLITFPVSTTNIFPSANSTAGGQLLTEFNLRAKDSVATSEKVQYMIGPSYVHGESDFYVRLQSDASISFHDAAPISSTVIEIMPGRAIINGHFVENLAPMTIDMITDVNNVLAKHGERTLSGMLVVGLKAMYSTEQTIAGSIEAEDADGMYEGIQVVILPESEFKLPEDLPNEEDEGYVTAHIKLATFNYYNGTVTNIINNYPAKCQVMSALRVGNIETSLSGDFVQKKGLNPKLIYGMAGKGTNPETGYDTWCDLTDSLVVWDNGIPKYVTENPAVKVATFDTDPVTGKTVLILPHKQIDSSTAGYNMENASGQQQYFAPVVLDLPKADFNNGTAGTVDGKYTNHIKDIAKKIGEIYNLPAGKQRAYIPILNSKDELPTINPAWIVGDYIVVGQDYTFDYTTVDGATRPASLYVVLPGTVTSVSYLGESISDISGVELCKYSSDSEPNTTDPTVYSTYWGDISQYNGNVGADYFTYALTDGDGNFTNYYFSVTSSGAKTYSNSILLTGGVPLAEENLVGGFLNVPENATDYGYVYLDSDGHLRLLDYALLRSGTAAYQLGEDFHTPNGLTISEIQAYLNEYVNQRIAFPNINQTQNSDPNTIHINLYISSEDEGGTLDIFDIDSRFNTGICIHVYGDAGSNVTINISDCARVQIDPNIGGNPVINLYRSSLYYDYTVLNYLNRIQDMSLWYEKYEETDPDLVVEGMTVRDVASESIYDTPNVSPIEYWSQDSPNDNHFTVALQSITFDSNGYVSGCGVLVRNSSTANIQLGKFVINDKFEFSQGPALYYPKSRFLKPVKVTGNFVTAYTTESPEGYIVQNTCFSLQSPCYDRGQNTVSDGNIAFLVDAYTVAAAAPLAIDVWDSGSFHHFDGTTLY